MIKAVIFDLDGTLIDAFDGHAESYNLALVELGHRPLSHKDFAKYYGQTGIEISRQLLKKPSIDDDVEKLTALKHKFYEKMGGGHIRALPGATDLIDALIKREVPMAIASSAAKGAIVVALKQIGAGDKIKAIVSANDIENSKPHPEIFLKAAKILKTAPIDCVVFEDSPWGVMAAKAAGMKCIAVTTGTTSKSDLKKLEPDMVLDSLEEILPPKLDSVLISIG